MINKTFFRGINNILSSKNNIKFDILLNYLSAFLRTTTASHPLEIQVEPSAVCNLKCKMCSLNKSTNQHKFLSSTDLSTILAKFKTDSVNLTGMGEILLNPDFSQLLKVCYDKNIKLSFTTNIQLLNQKHLQAIKKYPPANISISMESGYPKKYNHIRAGANLTKTIKNMRVLSDFIKKYHLPTKIAINVVFLDFNLKNLKHIKKIIDIAYHLKIKKITSQNITRISPYIKNLYVSQKIKLLFYEINSYSQNKQIEISLPSSSFSKNKCYYPWIYPQITATGEVLPCCVMLFGNYDYIVNKYSFGNILNHSLNDIWNGTKARKFRKNHPCHRICQHCAKNYGVL